MSSAEEQLCATEYLATGSPALAERLITANMRLVVTIALTYRRANSDLHDLIQEGNLGLIQAVERYDPTRGVKLCSYAAWWIRAYILKFILGNWRLVKTGTTQAQRKLFFGLRRERDRLERTGAALDTKQLAAVLNVKEKDVLAMLQRFNASEVSMDAPRASREFETTTLGDSLGASSSVRPDVRVEGVQFSRRVQDAIRAFGETLEKRELRIFQQRLISDEPLTLAQLATGFGVTRERTRQLEVRLVTRLRVFLKQELGDSLPGRATPARTRAPRAIRN
ncbi:MAG: polymerase sigma-32 factor [Myxococcales bacterium]|jgi:RNA polymerase sigma-32 factor|nr:polymerase sigma-32 factor [Myxococcales bacterium]